MQEQNKRANILTGKQQEMIARKTSLIIESDTAQSSIDMHKDVISRLEALQSKAVEQSAGVYNKLLTAIVHDVMQDIDQSIELNTEVKHNKPQLYIDSKKNGQSEDIVTDRGGSINNLISAGLRFIAIVQSGNRRFVAMDEQDCWLEENLVPRFIEVLDKLCKEIGVQCVFISHHDRELVQEKCQVVEFYNKQGTIEAHVNQSKRNNESVVDHKMGGEWFEGTGFRFIELNNIMSHKNTMIPLASSMTALVGSNDIGKSVVIRAIDAFKNNKATMNLLRHEEQSGSVRIGLEDDLVLHWSIEKNKSGKKLEASQYTLFDKDNKILKTASSSNGELPFWVNELLSMNSDDKMDAHIGHQKDPLFMLNPAISPSQRADLIDLGQEFHVVQKMFELHNDKMKVNRATIKRNKAELNILNKRLEQLSVLNAINEVLRRAGIESEQLNNNKAFQQQTEGILSQLNAGAVNTEVVEKLKTVLEQSNGEYVDINAATQLLALVKSDLSKEVAVVSSIKGLLNEDTSNSSTEIANGLYQKINEDLSPQVKLLDKIKDVLDQDSEPVKTKAGGAIKALTNIEKDLSKLKIDNLSLKKQQIEVDEQWNEAVINHGSSCPCPTCGQVLTPTQQPF
jgi:hypothetical protein